MRESGITNGTATVFIQHTSASLIIYENADPSARTDLHEFFERLGAQTKEKLALPGYYHDTLGERDRGELFARMRENPEAKLVAGATEIGVLINKRFTRFPQLISTELLGFFIVKLKIAFFGGLFIGFPVIATQIYRFVAPGSSMEAAT